MPQFDRETARAFVEAGYMPLADYIEIFAEAVLAETDHEVPLVPSLRERINPDPRVVNYSDPARVLPLKSHL